MKNIPVFYTSEMSAATASYSPSAGKPSAVVDDWSNEDLPIMLLKPQPLTREQVKKAHDSQHVDFIMDCDKPNGFGNRDEAVAQSLLYTTGAMHDAAKHALVAGVACAPVSGFHHAGWDFAGGFCTFNGLMIAALNLRDAGLVKSVGILDLDMHFGNGTENIIFTLGSRSWIEHYSNSFHPSEAEVFLRNLGPLITKMTERDGGLDLLMYQAGADSHVDDPLGGYLTSDQMRRRDRIVFETCRRLGVPVVWNLAGGYQRDEQDSIAPVLALHRATMEECVATYCR